jgi:hypothetical protein
LDKQDSALTKKKRRSHLFQGAIVTGGVILALVLWIFVGYVVDHKVEFEIGPSRGRIFAMELVVFSLILGPVALVEILTLSRIFTHRTKPAEPSLRNASLVFAAFAGSLAVYLAYVFCTQKLGLGE